MTAGLARSGFDLDLRHGVEREDALAKVLTLDTVEVKCDERCRDTGNLFIEVRQRGGAKPSGLSVTTASHWAIEVYAGVYVLVTTAYLKRLVKLAHHRFGTKQGGDFNRQVGVLVPVAWLVDRRQVERHLAEYVRAKTVRGRVPEGHIDFEVAA